jgi:FkbM family methyltransferase
MDTEPENAEAYFRQLIAEEAAQGEPELLLLPTLLRGAGTAIDVGANRGIYAFALSQIAREVHAFEPHPDFAERARRMLGARAIVHQLALSNARGRASFFVPIADDGTELHLAGNLKNTHAQFQRQKVIDTEIATLDSFALSEVTFIKVDVEGSELEVLEGGRATIARDRPTLLIELLSGTYADPLKVTRQVCDTYGYQAFVVHAGQRLDAQATIRSLNANTTWGSPIATRNVLFTPSEPGLAERRT